MTTHIEILHYC